MIIVAASFAVSIACEIKNDQQTVLKTRDVGSGTLWQKSHDTVDEERKAMTPITGKY